jgi:hypothetical protein
LAARPCGRPGGGQGGGMGSAHVSGGGLCRGLSQSGGGLRWRAQASGEGAAGLGGRKWREV